MSKFKSIQHTIIPEGWEPKPRIDNTTPNEWANHFHNWYLKYSEWCRFHHLENVYDRLVSRTN